MKKNFFSLLFFCSVFIFFVTGKHVYAENFGLGIESDPIQQRLDKSNKEMNQQSIALPKLLNTQATYYWATDNSLPNKDFIDVSSWNEYISVAQYQQMKRYGLRGVVVKLSEGTYYQNKTYMFSQINNAKAAGLTVSVYHYSKFKNSKEAVSEANFFANIADSLELSKNTVMVNDIEDYTVLGTAITNNSQTFAKQLNSRGYKNVIHYTSASWVWGASPLLDPKKIGNNNLWIAQYPVNPNKNNLLNSAYSAWQWASTLKYPNINTGIGTFDINIDYRGRFTGKIYDSINKSYTTDFPVQVKGKNLSSKHGVWSDVYNTREGIINYGNAGQYADKIGFVTEVASTNRSTYWKINFNQKDVWIDKDAFILNLDRVVSDSQIDYHLCIKDKSISNQFTLWSEPYRTSSSSEYLGEAGNYENIKFRSTNVVKTNSGGTFYKIHLNGNKVAWLDSKAFYEPIIANDSTSYRAEIRNDANKQGVWSAPYNTENNIKYYGNGGQYVGQTVSITKVAKTPRSTYLQFTLNGKTMWMDKAGFNEQLYPIIENENMQVTGTIKTDTVAKSQGIWQAPWNTQITNQYYGNASGYAGKTVQITKRVKLSTGTVYYQFSQAGKNIGWLDSKAFYEPIIANDSTSYRAEIRNDANKQGVWSAPYNTENNIKYYGNGGQYVGQTVSITKVAKTPRSTYLQFTLNGKTMWMDKAGFNEQLYPIIENENMQVTGTIKTDTVAKSQGIWQAPWNTQITNQYYGNASGYAGKTVQITKRVKLSTGTVYYQFSQAGKNIGWLDSKAFYELVLKEENYQKKFVINSTAIKTDVWSAPYNIHSGIRKIGTGEQFVNQEVLVLKKVITTKAVYLQFKYGENNYWMDENAFVDIVSKKNEEIPNSTKTTPDSMESNIID